jgi:photosystem II stability/assembly factor-like uncharacterized protein
MKPLKHLSTFLPLFAVILITVQGCREQVTEFNAGMLQNIKLRETGPGAMGGRISDIEVHPADFSTFFVSPSTGGIFKTTDNGRSWEPVFDDAGTTLAIGDMAISESDPEIIWAGTGEGSGEQSPSSVGDGIYKSVDGGATWQNMGLAGTRHFTKIVIDPADPNTVFAAATGARWGANEERGIYRTTDGGVTWEKVLYIDDNTGFGDLLMMPDGKTLFATSWFQRRSAWAHVQKGPTSGIYMSADGGENWEKIEKGLPGGNSGRIAIAYAPSMPERMYAVFENDTAGFFRSDDGGATWEMKNGRVRTSYWYGRIYVDPNDADRVWTMGVRVQETTDGGESFSMVRMENVHVDHHVVWFNPEDGDDILLGNDGGLYRTADRGDTWTFIANLPISQFYDISIDDREPYYIYGGLQDNGVWGFPSRSVTGNPVGGSDVLSINGGDGFYSAAVPGNPETVFAESQYGYIVRYSYADSTRKRVKPAAEEGEEELRFNWNTPFFVSVHPPYNLYIGSQFVHRSDDLGESWSVISDDLSRNYDLDSTLVLGQKPLLKPYNSMTALVESPLKKGLIYAGTDDGNLWVTEDDGESWKDLTTLIPGDQERFITRIVPSMHDESTVYVAYGRFYEADDLSPWLFVSRDRGNSWSRITEGMDDQAVVMAFAEHPLNHDMLFAGVHNGLYISANGGASWSRLTGSLPYVQVSDIVFSPESHDMILATYGRGIWIGDKWSFAGYITDEIVASGMHLFEPVVAEAAADPTDNFEPDPFTFYAPDPEAGILTDFYLSERLAGKDITVTLFTAAREELKSVQAEAAPGFNRVVIKAGDLEAGSYTVELKAGKKTASTDFSVN